MKKIVKIVTVVCAMVLFLFTPATVTASNGLLKLTPATDETSYQFEAANQDSTLFTSAPISFPDMSNWITPSENSLISQKVSAGFYDTCENKSIALSNSELGSRSPYIIGTNKLNMSARGCYTTSAITLPSNGYYKVSVKYYLKDQDDTTINKTAFGTFYLNEEQINLNQYGWADAVFYIHTDVLENASVVPELYFGSRYQNALGAIYFDDFSITAINQNTFNQAKNNYNAINTKFIELSKENEDYVLVKGFNNNQFTSVTKDNGASWQSVNSSDILTYLNFSDNRHFFNMKDNTTSEVMLMKANASDATLTLKASDWTFSPKPYEVYMFQFYSIANANSEFKFYLNLTTTGEEKIPHSLEITNLSNNSSYYNGWQLNTYFFVAGHDLPQNYELSFSLTDNNSSTNTGWVCLDEFKIYKVSSSYATNNATATGVHNTYDMNSNSESMSIANGNFKLGSSTDIKDSNYPYPLVAKDWTTTSNENGIVNMEFWKESFGPDPKYVPSITNHNNNVYMMRNTTSMTNTLTSPAFTTTANETTYLTFDAYSTAATKTTAYIITADTDENGAMTNIVRLNDAIKINAGDWKSYTICISENEFATTRSYYLQFNMEAAGYAYIDNVRIISNVSDNTNLESKIDLTNPLTIKEAWQSNSTSIQPSINNGVLSVANVDGRKVTITNTFAYNFTKDSYYKFIITAKGDNAYLSLNGYEGLLKVDTEDDTEYQIYIKVGDTNTPTFQIIIGASDDNEAQVDGNVTISSIQVTNIEEIDYTDAQEKATVEGSHKLILAPTDTAETETTNTEEAEEENSNFLGENWWYLIPTLITAVAILMAVATFLFRKIKFEKHITKKHTSYARDMRLKNQQKKIVAQKATKVDNINDESQSN